MTVLSATPMSGFVWNSKPGTPLTVSYDVLQQVPSVLLLVGEQLQKHDAQTSDRKFGDGVRGG